MQRELIIPVKSQDYDQEKVKLEINLVKKMLPYLESFYSFVVNNELFDLSNHKRIKRSHLLKDIFTNGTANKQMCFIICKN